jgi:hypothetical protein
MMGSQKNTALQLTALASSSDIAATLEDARRLLEEKFLAAGGILLRSIEGTKSLIGSLETLTKIFDSSIVAETTTDLTVAAAKLCALPASHAARSGYLKKLNSCRETLAGHISDMRSSLAYMKAFTLNIKIVAGSINVMGDEFGTFADEISSCITRGGEHLKYLEKDLSLLQRNLSSAMTQGDVLERQIYSLLPAVPDELAASAGVIAEHYKSISETTGCVAKLARSIHQRVARILAALQIGDITRQRIEHVQACIIRHKVAESSGTANRRAQASCYALMAAHLEEIAADFDSGVKEIEQSMAGMADDAGKLLALHNMAFGCAAGTGEGFLHYLSARAEDAMRLVKQIEAADQAAIATGHETMQTAQNLSERIEAVQSFRDDVQYMALNTTLKCCQIGDACRPLAVIAVEIQDPGKKLEVAASDSLSTLDSLIALTRKLSDVEDTDGQDDSKSLAAAEALDIALRRIEQARDLTEKNISETAAKGDDVYKMLNMSSEKLCFRKEIKDILECVTADIAAMTNGGYTPDETMPAAFIASLEEVAESYTMAQERNLHNKFLEGLNIKPQEAAPPQDEDDSVLF